MKQLQRTTSLGSPTVARRGSIGTINGIGTQSSSSSPLRARRAVDCNAIGALTSTSGAARMASSSAPAARRGNVDKNESAVMVSALLRGLAAPRSLDLHRNIFLNPNPESSLKHVELTDDSIRLEFSKATAEYKRHAELMFLTEEEKEERGVEEWLIPLRLKNLTFCGGGATIELDRRKVIQFLTRPRLNEEFASTNGAAAYEHLHG